MGVKLDFEFDISELNSALEKLEKKVSDKIKEKALNKGADIILKEQQNNVPVKTGKLKRSLGKSKVKKSNQTDKITIGILNATDNEVEYGYYQEYGTSSIIGKKWMKRSWNESIEDAREEIKKSLSDDLTNL